MSLPATPPTAAPRRALSLLDTTSIIVGIIIGSAIYQSAPAVAASAAGWVRGVAVAWSGGSAALSEQRLATLGVAAMLGVWIVGGVVALVGAMCYAELATAYPEAGGTYVFLSEALGRSVGFAFAWCEFWIVRPGNVGAVAFVLAAYARQMLPENVGGLPQAEWILAALAVSVLAVLNAIGLRAGTRTQNVLTLFKVLGLAAIVVTALTLPSTAIASRATVPEAGSLTLALILVMFAYGGWADMSFVAAEVRDPGRNIFRALVLGTGAVATIYVAVNLAFVHALGIGGLAGSQAAAAEVLSLRFGEAGSKAISLLVVVSCLGAINGMLFTGSRVYYALGTHHATFRWLGTWNERGGVPLRSLVLQTLVTLGLIAGFGLYEEGFERLVVFTGPFYWGFIALVGVALILLRYRRDPGAGDYRVPLFPLTPLLFTASSGAMVYAAVSFAISNRSPEAAWAIGVVVVGLVVGSLDWRSRRSRAVAP
jgi:basic amino acid/polyamine antiporter, APA family